MSQTNLITINSGQFFISGFGALEIRGHEDKFITIYIGQTHLTIRNDKPIVVEAH